jgi:pre-rRNA-processing protein TSR1
MATCYGPIIYSPAPVMIYKRHEGGGLVLVATGNLQAVNPDRIILKRVVLTGYPIRVRKKFAVVKHMFYNPEDVLWFKPAELVTKHGLRGHITETVGTHGLYKSQFNAPITQVH